MVIDDYDLNYPRHSFYLIVSGIYKFQGMKTTLLIFYLIISIGSEAQKRIRVKLTSTSSASLKISVPLRIVEKDIQFSIPPGFDKYFVKRHVFDEIQYIYERYFNGKISVDSFRSILKRTNGRNGNYIETETRNAVFIFIGKRKDSTVALIVDINNNRDFKDDSVFHFIKKRIIGFNILLDRVENKKKYSQNYPLELIADFSVSNFEKSVVSDFSILLRPISSKFGKLNIESQTFSFEIFATNIKSINKLNSFQVNFSEPNISLQPIDFNETILYNPQTDTIVVGNYQFKIRTISLLNDIAEIDFTRIDNKKNGYKVGYYIPDFSLDILQDSLNTTRTSLKKVVGPNKLIILDFWGTWCTPCIRNFPLLRELDSQFTQWGVITLGIACEYKRDLSLVTSTLQRYKIFWKNAILEKGNADNWDISDFLNIDSFPAYLLIDRNLKIIGRYIGTDGIEKLKNYLTEKFANN